MEWHEGSRRARVAVLAGGESAEREISLLSGIAVSAALTQAGYAVEMIDPSQCQLAAVAWDDFDACFIALHGGAGEDGRIQRQLEQLCVPYTGSRPAACRLAMSKSASKERFLQAGVPSLPYVLFQTCESAMAVAAKVVGLGYPLIVKPDSQGSSLGVSIARGPVDLQRCLDAARQYDAYALAEPFIHGREFTVSVLQGRALPLLEIFTGGALFDYAAKYDSPDTQYCFDPDLESDSRAALEQLAVEAASAIQMTGLCRVDLIMDAHGRPWVLEVNAVPGMTSHSLAPLAARQAGIAMPQLCDLLVQQCLKAKVRQ